MLGDYTPEQLGSMKPNDFRLVVRQGKWRHLTFRACRNYAQNNIAIVPKEYAFEFFQFCQRNPRPCPVVEVTDPGSIHPKFVAPDADIRTDVPRYRVFINGELVDEPTDIVKYWRDDFVTFLIGCSLTFDWALLNANVHFHMHGAFVTKVPCVPAGRFSGNLVVSLRAFDTSADAVRAVQVGSRYLLSHGPPIHIGDPSVLGITDLRKPIASHDSEPQLPKPHQILMWWGCGITPQMTAQAARLPIFITHKGGHMFVNDLLIEETANL